MFRTLRHYIVHECAPRWWDIIVTPETLISVLVVVGFVEWGDKLFSSNPKIGDLSTGLIAYASIALGFCVAGLTISLTLPDRDFASKLATLKRSSETTNAYSDLLFVFSWTAVVHWVAVLVLFGVILFTESSSALLPSGHSAVRKWLVALVAGICAYCLCQFLITLITLSQFGAVYIKHLADFHANKEDQPGSTGDQ